MGSAVGSGEGDNEVAHNATSCLAKRTEHQAKDTAVGLKAGGRRTGSMAVSMCEACRAYSSRGR